MYRRALVPLDGSPVAEAIIPFLLEIAGPLDMSIVLVQVLEPITPIVGDGMQQVVMDDPETRAQDAAEYLAPIAAMLGARGVTASWAVRRGQPAEEIVEAAGEARADLIAMSTHGRSGLGRLLFGSVAERVLRHAEVPVFMMRQTEAQLAAKAATEHALHRFGVPGRPCSRGSRT